MYRQPFPNEILKPGKVPNRKARVSNYKEDKYYPKVLKAFGDILIDGSEIKPVEVFQRMHLLKSEDLENWYFGRVPFLEKVIRCNLSKVSRITRLIGFIAHDFNMGKSIHRYAKRGKGKKVVLQFSKSNIKALEQGYSTHYSIIGSREKFIAKNKQHLWPEVKNE